MSESNGSTCQQNHTWDNWAGTIQFQTDCYFEPVTTGDLTNILQQAQTNGKKVRVVGSGHSWSLGAVPGDAPYQPNANIDAYLINIGNMNPENSAQDSYLKAFYFKDSAGIPYVAVPPGTTQGWIADNAANANDLLHQHSNKHEDLALASMGPAPDITLGGFIANGCHGTGWEQTTVADLVFGIEVMTVDGQGNVLTKAYTVNQELADILNQNHVTKAQAQASPDTMSALRASLGALGVITKLVFQLVPMFNVAHLDEYVDLDQIFPSNGDTTNLQTLVTSCDYIEIFWFPFTTQLWVKRYSKIDAPIQHESKVVDFVFITSELASLTGSLMGDWFKLFPAATPLTLQVFFFALKELMQRELKAFNFNDDFDKSQDPIVPVRDAYLYQKKYFTNLLDLSYTIPMVQTQATPAQYDFSKVIDAWNNAVSQIEVMQNEGVYPVNLNVHIRFIKNSDSLLSPANQAEATTHTCYIEYLSFSQQIDGYVDFSQVVGPEWANHGGLPHWAKIFQIVPGAYADAHQKLQDRGSLQPFLNVRQELDPNGIFMNDFLNELLNGSASETKKTMTVRSAISAQVSATSHPVAQFQLTDAGVLEKLKITNNEMQKSGGGCSLAHDPSSLMAMLVDETGQGHLLQYDYDSAANRISYSLLSPSQFLSPGEVFRRVGEVLKSQC
jgi:FAD/FMN-containing dehydrogenase